MNVEYLAFPTNKFPCFGFAVCAENDKLFIPEYNEDNTVDRFEEMLFEVMYLYKYSGKHEIRFGDTLTYAYMLDERDFFYGTMEQIRPQLIGAINRINDAPFSKLELAEFLRLDECDKKSIQNECYTFLYKIDKKQAKMWALENSYTPLDQLAKEQDVLSAKTMQDFAKRLYAFSVHSDRLIASSKAHKKNSSPQETLDNIQVFLQALCRCVNEAFFDYGGARTHFRFLHSGENKYRKLAAARDEYAYQYSMTAIPAVGEGMIFRVALYNEPLIYSLYEEFHFGTPFKDATYKDYITFVLMDDDLKYKGKCLLSMGISTIYTDYHLNIFYLLKLLRFDNIITSVIKSYATITDIDIVNTIVEQSDYILERFDSVVKDADEEESTTIESAVSEGAEFCTKPTIKFDEGSIESTELTTFDLEEILFKIPFCNPNNYEYSCHKINNYLNKEVNKEIHSGEYKEVLKPPMEILQILIVADILTHSKEQFRNK